MRFLPDHDHRAYTATVRRLLADAEPVRAARAWAAGDHGPGRTLWSALAGTGLPSLAVAEDHDGLGWYPPELASAFVEIGRSGAPGPLVETVAVAAGLSAGAAGSGRSPGPWLPRVLAGDALVTVAGPASPYALDAHTADAAFAVEGEALLLAAPDGAPRASVDPTRHLVRLTRAEPVPADVARVCALATLLTAAQALGVGRALLDGSVEHVSRRTQFGRPVGSFQAVKHHLATVAVALEFAEPLLYGAAVALRGEGRSDPRDLPAAKAACGEAAYSAARTALQVHGALGYTDEYDLTLHLRKARALRTAWGSPSACRAAVLAAPDGR